MEPTRLKSIGLSLTIPHFWTMDTSKKKEGEVVYDARLANVTLFSTTSNVTPEDASKAMEASMRQKASSDSSIQVDSNTTETIGDGITAYKVTFTQKENGMTFKCTFYFFSKNGKAYMVSFIVPTFMQTDANMKMFNQVIQSIRIL